MKVKTKLLIYIDHHLPKSRMNDLGMKDHIKKIINSGVRLLVDTGVFSGDILSKNITHEIEFLDDQNEVTPHIYELYWTEEMLKRIYGEQLSQSVIDKFKKRADKSSVHIHEVIDDVFFEILANLVEEEKKK